MTFLDESVKWIAQYDYSLYATAGNKIIFTSNKAAENYPIIICIEEDGNRYCELEQTNGYKLFLTLKSGRLQYKHKNIERFISAMKHYADIATQSPPF